MTDPGQLGRPEWARRIGSATVPGRAVLAVDGTGLLVRCSRAAQRNARLTAADGTPTATLLFFIAALAKQLRTVRPAYAIVTWDGPDARRWRRELYPGYKANRPLSLRGAKDTDLALAMEFCTASSIRQLMIPGFEADDLLAAVQRQVVAEAPGAYLMVHSDDADLLQLLGDEMTVVTCLGSGAYMTAMDVQAGWMVPPWWLACARALAGDESDNIPGLPGVGPQRAVQMLARGSWRWPLPEDVLPGEEERALVAAWRDIMELVAPSRRPEDDPAAGADYFTVEGRAEWTRPDNDAVRSFFGKYQLASLSGKLANGRLW